jgi:rhodanese-related sulfurtransferase
MDCESLRSVVACDSQRNAELGYPFILSFSPTMVQVACPHSHSNLHLAGSGIFAGLSAVFFAGADNTATGNMCTNLLFNVVHQGLHDYSHRNVHHSIRGIDLLDLVGWQLQLDIRRSLLQRDKNVIVLCSEPVKSNQNASERVPGKPFTNQL